MATRFYDPRIQPTDSNGNPYPAARMYFYTVLTTTPMTAYSSLSVQTSATSLGSYIVADGDGVFPEAYLPSNNYRVILKDSTGVIIDDYDVYTPSSSVGAGGIGTTELADGSVTNIKLAGNITGAKLANGTITKDQLGTSAVEEAKIAAQAVTAAKIKLATITADQIAPTTITGAKMVNGTVAALQLASDSVTTVKILNANVTAAKLDGAQSGSAPIYGIRAWASCDGTEAGANPKTLTLNGSGNITSVVRTATGKYTVTFATTLSDANFTVVTGGGGVVSSTSVWCDAITNKATTGFDISFINTALAYASPTNLSFIVIR